MRLMMMPMNKSTRSYACIAVPMTNGSVTPGRRRNPLAAVSFHQGTAADAYLAGDFHCHQCCAAALGLKPERGGHTAGIRPGCRGVSEHPGAHVQPCLADEHAHQAKEQDTGRWGVLWSGVVLSTVVMVALSNELLAAKSGGALAVVVGALSVVLSWMFLNTMFAMHYAHGFYGDMGDKHSGLDFPTRRSRITGILPISRS
jgi:hypothetical protein